MSIENLNPERWGESAFSYEEEFGYEPIEGDYDFSPVRWPRLVRPAAPGARIKTYNANKDYHKPTGPLRRPAALHRPEAMGYKRGTLTFQVVAQTAFGANSALPALPLFGTAFDLNTQARTRVGLLVDPGTTFSSYNVVTPVDGGDLIRSANASGKLDVFLPEQNPNISLLYGLLGARSAIRFRKVRFNVPSALQAILDNAVFAIVSVNPLSAADVNQQSLGVSKSPQQFQPNIVDLEFAQPLTVYPHQFFVVKFGSTPVGLAENQQVATISFGVDADLEIVPL